MQGQYQLKEVKHYGFEDVYKRQVIKGGEVIFKGRDLMKLSNAEMEEIRGNEISMIFQEPSTALNPVIPIGKQIEENILIHTDPVSYTHLAVSWWSW